MLHFIHFHYYRIFFMYIPHVLIQSPVEGLAGCLWFGTIKSTLLYMLPYTWLFLHVGIFLLGIYIGLALPVRGCANLQPKQVLNQTAFPSSCTRYILTQHMKIHCFHLLTNTCYCQSINFSPLVDMSWYHVVVLIYIS